MTSKIQQKMHTEFQAVILAGGPGQRMSPLNALTPKPLLPVANRPLLYYQLRLLEHAGFSNVIIVTCKAYSNDIATFLSYHRSPMAVDFSVIEETEGTADVLRQIKDKLFTDFMLISGDLITEASLYDLADVHRTRDATVTMLFKEQSLDPVERKKHRKASNGIIDYVGVVDKEEDKTRFPRVVYLHTGFPDEGVDVPKSLLKREPNIAIKTHLADAHLYIFKRWVVDILDEKKKMSSIRLDLLPYLVKLQYRGADLLPESVRDVASTVQRAQSMSANQSSFPTSSDVIRCYAMVVPEKGPYVARANNLTVYSAVNREVAGGSIAASTPWEKPLSKTETKFKGSLFGEMCEIGEKVTVKNCIVGKHCKIGAKAKLNNCILMDFVSVGPDAIIQNTILCDNSVIKERCNLNDCQVAKSAVVQEGSRLKGESIMGSNGDTFGGASDDDSNVMFE